MRFLRNNQQLFDYLINLNLELKKRGLLELSEVVNLAIGTASSISTEFLGESRIALGEVLRKGSGALTEQERSDLESVLQQLDVALGQG